METFSGFWKFEIISIFLEFSDLSTLQGALNKKLRKNHFKTSLDTLGIRFGYFWKFENFSIFVAFFFESPGCTGQSFSPSKKSIKTCSNNVFGNVFGHVLKVQSLSSFSKFFQVSTLRGALASFSKRIPQSKFRTCLDTIRISFGHFKNIEIFLFFSIFSSLEPPGCTDQKFYQNSYLEACWKRVWTLLRTISGILKKNENSVFPKFFHVSTLRGALGIFFAKLTSKQVQNLFGHFWKRFPGFWKFECFSNFWNFSTSLPSRVHWPKNFEKITSKQVWTLLESVLDIYESLKIFRFLWIFFESPGCTGQSFSPSKKSIKTCSNNVFGNVFGHVLKVQSLSSFSKFFQVSTLRGALAFFSQNKIPLSKIRTCLDTIRNSFGHLKNIWIFQFFSIFFSWTSRVHWAKILAKTWSRNMFKACLIAFRNVFWAFWKIEMFSCFLKFTKFRPSRVHWAYFSKKVTSKQVQQLVWTLLGTFLDTSEISNFLNFFL